MNKRNKLDVHLNKWRPFLTLLTLAANGQVVCHRLYILGKHISVSQGNKQWFFVLSNAFEHDRVFSNRQKNFRARDAVESSINLSVILGIRDTLSKTALIPW